MHPQKLLAFVQHPHKAAKPGIFLPQPGVELAQDGSGKLLPDLEHREAIRAEGA